MPLSHHPSATKVSLQSPSIFLHERKSEGPSLSTLHEMIDGQQHMDRDVHKYICRCDGKLPWVTALPKALKSATARGKEGKRIA